MAGRDGLFDAFEQRWPDAGQAFKLSLLHHFLYVAVERIDSAGGILIRAHLEDAAALFQREQGGNVFQQGSNLILIHCTIPTSKVMSVVCRWHFPASTNQKIRVRWRLPRTDSVL